MGNKIAKHQVPGQKKRKRNVEKHRRQLMKNIAIIVVAIVFLLFMLAAFLHPPIEVR